MLVLCCPIVSAAINIMFCFIHMKSVVIFVLKFTVVMLFCFWIIWWKTIKKFQNYNLQISGLCLHYTRPKLKGTYYSDGRLMNLGFSSVTVNLRILLTVLVISIRVYSNCDMYNVPVFQDLYLYDAYTFYQIQRLKTCGLLHIFYTKFEFSLFSLRRNARWAFIRKTPVPNFHSPPQTNFRFK